MAYGAHMPIRKPQKLDRTTLTAFAVVIVYGLVLHVLRMGVDAGLRALHAPMWTSWATAVAVLILWVAGGVWIYRRLTRK